MKVGNFRHTALPETLLLSFDLGGICGVQFPMRSIKPYRLPPRQFGGPELDYQTAAETRWQAKQVVDLLRGETIGEHNGPGQLRREILHEGQQQ
jgi:hypothetical protein